MSLSPLDPAGLPPAVDVSDNSAALHAVDEVIARGPYDATWDSLTRYQPPQWYRDARFGIFIHWGAISVPAFGNEWYPRTMYQQGTAAFEHHRTTYGPHRSFGYKDFLPHLTMEHFDPAQWAGLFRRAGAQYVVPVAEHHDGFAMYETARSRWHTGNIGPRRDVFGELLTALDEAWLVSGASSHRAEHWFYMNPGLAFDSDVRDPDFLDLYGPALRKEVTPTERFLEDWLLRTVEIIDTYRPQLLYFDTGIEEPSFEPYLRRLAAYYYNRAAQWGREVVINAKWEAFRPGSVVPDLERGSLATTSPEIWQNDTSVSRSSWCWVPDHDYKSAADLLAELADAVSKNGNFLLNIGPKADGTIAEEEAGLLEAIGDWLAVNGESIYGSSPWRIHAEGPTRTPAGPHSDGAAASYGVGDYRFTAMTEVGHDYVYAIALTPVHADRLRVRSFGRSSGLLERPITDVRVLGFRGELIWTVTDDALEVVLPEELPPTAGGPVIRIELAPEEPHRRIDFFHGIGI
ncbi:alpha-L-fucosidase [Bogoriella caseilytica]|uniref:alpha-L-fucosidase n=1 Tax=Bogoriella caseilytica TaxID=56055 RepID=A0A3N2BAP6_9MICO|nr:alpha-L-fucosidase [Bogoriella caseilytica]ROR72258.1 alpha-L-fucosidase [Bogoriella caseilytica]